MVLDADLERIRREREKANAAGRAMVRDWLEQHQFGPYAEGMISHLNMTNMPSLRRVTRADLEKTECPAHVITRLLQQLKE